MYLPNEKDLADAVLYYIDSPAEYSEKLNDAARDSVEFLGLWSSMVATALDIKIPDLKDPTGGSVEEFLLDMRSSDSKAFSTAQQGLLAGIEMGLFIAQKNGVSPVAREAIPTPEALRVAATKFAHDGKAGGLDGAAEIAKIYSNLIKDRTFGTVLELSYILSKAVDGARVSDFDRQASRDELAANGDLTRAVGVALAFGLMIGGRLPLTTPVNEAKEQVSASGGTENSINKVRGGWR